MISAEHRVLNGGYQYTHLSMRQSTYSPFNIEPEDFDAIIVLSFDSFLSSIEFLALIDILSACITSPVF